MSEDADLAAAYLTRAARSIADGDLSRARTHFTAAWRHATPAIKRIAWNRLANHDLVDEAVSHTGVKMWGSVRRGYTPIEGWAQILLTSAQRACYDILEQHTRRAPERHELAEHHEHPAVEHDTSSSKLELLARTYDATGHRLWAQIVRAVALRTKQDRSAPIEWHEIAADLDRTAVDIRVAVHQMRSDPDLLTLFGQDAAPDAEIPEQTQLFDTPTPNPHAAA